MDNIRNGAVAKKKQKKNTRMHSSMFTPEEEFVRSGSFRSCDAGLRLEHTLE